MSDNTSDIDEIIKELKDSSSPKSTKQPISQPVPKVTDENVGDYIYDKSVEMIELAMQSIKDMQDLIRSAADSKEVSAYAQLLNTAFKGIENLNKINIQQKQAKNNLEVKKIEAEAKSKNPNNPLLGAASQQTNNIFIGSRDEAMKILNSGGNKTKKIALESNEVIDDEY